MMQASDDNVSGEINRWVNQQESLKTLETVVSEMWKILNTTCMAK